MNNFFKGLMTVSAAALLSNCTPQNSNAPVSQPQNSLPPVAPEGLKIAYVEYDSLLLKYDLYLTLQEEVMKKEENSRLLITEESKKLEKEIADFQKKLQNNVFSSQERAQSEQDRLIRKEQELNALAEKLSNELADMTAKNSKRISDAIHAFLDEYNKEKGYTIILSKIGDNILLVDPALNVTDDVLSGLNKAGK